jgi:hypothetical protein
LILQVNNPAAMNLALNNAINVAQYKERGEKVKIEVVTFGSGLIAARRHVAGKDPHRGDGAEYGGGSRPAATPIGIEQSTSASAASRSLIEEQRLLGQKHCS